MSTALLARCALHPIPSVFPRTRAAPPGHKPLRPTLTAAQLRVCRLHPPSCRSLGRWPPARAGTAGQGGGRKGSWGPGAWDAGCMHGGLVELQAMQAATLLPAAATLQLLSLLLTCRKARKREATSVCCACSGCCACLAACCPAGLGHRPRGAALPLPLGSAGAAWAGCMAGTWSLLLAACWGVDELGCTGAGMAGGGRQGGGGISSGGPSR